MQTRRRFLQQAAFSAAAAASVTALTPPVARAAEQVPAAPPIAAGGSGNQRRWRVAFGLNGFQSSEDVYGQTFPIWEVLEFAQREGFDGIELVPGWLKGTIPATSI